MCRPPSEQAVGAVAESRIQVRRGGRVEDCTPSVYESSNSGTVWTRRFTGSSSPSISGDVACPGGYTRYTHGLTVYPVPNGQGEETTLFLSGLHLCRSINRGATWTSVDNNTRGG